MNRNGGMWFRCTFGIPSVLEVILDGDLPLLKCTRDRWYFVAEDKAHAEQCARVHFRHKWICMGRNPREIPDIKATEYWARKGQFQEHIEYVSADLLVRLGFRPTVAYQFK